jgi:hypothetical protein
VKKTLKTTAIIFMAIIATIGVSIVLGNIIDNSSDMKKMKYNMVRPILVIDEVFKGIEQKYGLVMSYSISQQSSALHYDNKAGIQENYKSKRLELTVFLNEEQQARIKSMKDGGLSQQEIRDAFMGDALADIRQGISGISNVDIKFQPLTDEVRLNKRQLDSQYSEYRKFIEEYELQHAGRSPRKPDDVREGEVSGAGAP